VKSALKVALVVPNYAHEWDHERHCRIKNLRAACRNGEIDLVVFPEAYDWQDGRKIQAIADDWAGYLEAPAIVGIGTDDGFQTAVYRNPSPRRGETATHVYVKHSTADRVAFEWPEYRYQSESMFKPILLRGRNIAVQICHDMFFGLLGQRMKREGAEVFIDITGGGVNLRKWTNVIQGRSLELAAPFLCTMAKRPREGGASRAIALSAGRLLRPTCRNVGAEGFGGYVVYELGAVHQNGASEDDDGEAQAFTAKRYRDITLTVNGEAPADICIDSDDGGVRVRGEAIAAQGAWRCFQGRVGRVGVLSIPLARLWDGRALYHHLPDRGAFDHHVVVYFARAKPVALDDVLALMRLRAVEHRVGVVVVAGEYREALKTNRYKNVQRFQEVNGSFGLNAEFLGGTWSTAGSTPGLGIPERFFDRYLAVAAEGRGGNG
jgi:hypothetical protein